MVLMHIGEACVPFTPFPLHNTMDQRGTEDTMNFLSLTPRQFEYRTHKSAEDCKGIQQACVV